MEKWEVGILLVSGFLLLILSIVLRARFGEKFELRSVDLVLIVIPLLLALLITGRVQVLDAFGIKADFSKLFSDAAGEDIQKQISLSGSPDVNELVHMLEMSSKGGVQDIPQLIQRKTEALLFRLGHGGYYGPAIRQYFDALYASSYFQYLIIQRQDDRLFGIYDALDLAVYFRTEGDSAYRSFARWLNDPSQSALNHLAELPGFMDLGMAVTRTGTKREVLRQMDSLRVQSLPVVDQDDVFVGTVERSKLTASLMLDIADRLEHAASQP